MNEVPDDHPVRALIARIDAAWRDKRFDGFEECFHEDAVIVGPGYVVYAEGREACAKSYRDFATNAAIRAYAESGHVLRAFEASAVYTFAWQMEYEHAGVRKRDRGTDQMVFGLAGDRWQLVWRHVDYTPDDDDEGE